MKEVLTGPSYLLESGVQSLSVGLYYRIEFGHLRKDRKDAYSVEAKLK
jgi:hypothetical protein